MSYSRGVQTVPKKSNIFYLISSIATETQLLQVVIVREDLVLLLLVKSCPTREQQDKGQLDISKASLQDINFFLAIAIIVMRITTWEIDPEDLDEILRYLTVIVDQVLDRLQSIQKEVTSSHRAQVFWSVGSYIKVKRYRS